MYVLYPTALQTEFAKRTGLEVTSAGAGEVYYVKDVTKPESQEREVDMSRGMKSVRCCAYVIQHQQPCRHMIPIFWKKRMLATARSARATINRFWPKWALAANYNHIYGDKYVRRPQLYNGPFVGPEEDKLLPPEQTSKKRGRPKRKRYRWRPKTVKRVRDWHPDVTHPMYAEILEYV